MNKDEIDKQIEETKKRGQQIVDYLDKYKGQSIYSEIALAIEFGYQIRLAQEEFEEEYEDFSTDNGSIHIDEEGNSHRV